MEAFTLLIECREYPNTTTHCFLLPCGSGSAGSGTSLCRALIQGTASALDLFSWLQICMWSRGLLPKSQKPPSSNLHHHWSFHFPTLVNRDSICSPDAVEHSGFGSCSRSGQPVPVSHLTLLVLDSRSASSESAWIRSSWQS